MDRVKKKKDPSNCINHSCKPNCVLEQWCIDKLPHMCFFVNKDITCGEELTFHCNWEMVVKNVEGFKKKLQQSVSAEHKVVKD